MPRPWCSRPRNEPVVTSRADEKSCAVRSCTPTSLPSACTAPDQFQAVGFQLARLLHQWASDSRVALRGGDIGPGEAERHDGRVVDALLDHVEELEQLRIRGHPERQPRGGDGQAEQGQVGREARP